MSLGPMQVGDTQPPMYGQFKQGKDDYSLGMFLPTDIVVHMWNDNTETHKIGQGTCTITDSQQGMFTYHWNAQDTSTPGLWRVWCELDGTAGKASSINEEPLQITDRVVV